MNDKRDEVNQREERIEEALILFGDAFECLKETVRDVHYNPSDDLEKEVERLRAENEDLMRALAHAPPKSERLLYGHFGSSLVFKLDRRHGIVLGTPDEGHIRDELGLDSAQYFGKPYVSLLDDSSAARVSEALEMTHKGSSFGAGYRRGIAGFRCQATYNISSVPLACALELEVVRSPDDYVIDCFHVITRPVGSKGYTHNSLGKDTHKDFFDEKGVRYYNLPAPDTSIKRLKK